MVKKYTKEQIYRKLGISVTWSGKKKKKHIREQFKEWNAKTNILCLKSDKEELKEAEDILEVCAQAMIMHPSPPHKRNYTKEPTEKKKPRKKRKPRKKKTVKKSDNGGCLVPIVMLLSSASLFIFCILYFL